MTSASGQWAREARSTSRPSPSGIRRSVTITSNPSSVSALMAAATPSTSVTWWPRFLRRRPRVLRAEGSSSTMRMVAIVVLSPKGEENGEARPASGRRLDLDPPAVGRHNAPGDGEAEAGARGLARVEGLEDPAALLGGHAASGVADVDGDLSLAEADRDAETPRSVHGFRAVQGYVPHHLSDLIRVEGERRHLGIDAHGDLHVVPPARVVTDEGRHLIDDLADVAHEPLGLAGTGEAQEVGEDPVEPPRLLLHHAQGVSALLSREGFFHTEERGGVDDGGQGITDLVGHAGRKLTGRGQALRLGEAGLQPLAFRHVGDQLEEEHLAVGLPYGRAAERVTPSVRAGHVETLRRTHLTATLERTAGAGVGAGSDRLVAAAAGDRAELLVHPPVGVTDREVAAHELEAFPEAVDQPLVELLERRCLAAGPVQDRDDDGEGT